MRGLLKCLLEGALFGLFGLIAGVMIFAVVSLIGLFVHWGMSL